MEEEGSDHDLEPVQEEQRDDDATVVPSLDFSPPGVPDQAFADPMETVQTFERTDQALFLDECKVYNYKMATINSWISHRIGKEKMPKVRTARDELSAALIRLPPGNRPAVDAIAVGWGLSVTAAAKIGERSLCNLIAACYVLGQLTPSKNVGILQHKLFRISDFCGTSPRSAVSQFTPLPSRQSSGIYPEACLSLHRAKKTCSEFSFANPMQCRLHEPMSFFF